MRNLVNFLINKKILFQVLFAVTSQYKQDETLYMVQIHHLQLNVKFLIGLNQKNFVIGVRQ